MDENMKIYILRGLVTGLSEVLKAHSEEQSRRDQEARQAARQEAITEDLMAAMAAIAELGKTHVRLTKKVERLQREVRALRRGRSYPPTVESDDYDIELLVERMAEMARQSAAASESEPSFEAASDPANPSVETPPGVDAVDSLDAMNAVDHEGVRHPAGPPSPPEEPQPAPRARARKKSGYSASLPPIVITGLSEDATSPGGRARWTAAEESDPPPWSPASSCEESNASANEAKPPPATDEGSSVSLGVATADADLMSLLAGVIGPTGGELPGPPRRKTYRC